MSMITHYIELFINSWKFAILHKPVFIHSKTMRFRDGYSFFYLIITTKKSVV